MKTKDKTLNIENKYFKVIEFDTERYEKNKMCFYQRLNKFIIEN